MGFAIIVCSMSKSSVPFVKAIQLSKVLNLPYVLYADPDFHNRHPGLQNLLREANNLNPMFIAL